MVKGQQVLGIVEHNQNHIAKTDSEINGRKNPR